MPLIPGQGQPTVGIQVPVPTPVSSPRTNRQQTQQAQPTQPTQPTTPNTTSQPSSPPQQRTPTAVIFPWSLVRRR